MNAFLTDNEIVHFDRKLGFITQNKVILTNGSNKQDRISFDAIDKVNLIKYRVLYTNAALLALSVGILIASLLYWNPEKSL